MSGIFARANEVFASVNGVFADAGDDFADADEDFAAASGIFAGASDDFAGASEVFAGANEDFADAGRVFAEFGGVFAAFRGVSTDAGGVGNRTASGSERVRAATCGPHSVTPTRSLPLAVLLVASVRKEGGVMRGPPPLITPPSFVCLTPSLTVGLLPEFIRRRAPLSARGP